MSDKKYVVPEGMLAAVIAYMGWDEPNEDQCANRIGVEVRRILEVAIRWQAENPRVPTDEQLVALVSWYKAKKFGNGYMRDCAVEWQRRMYLAPESEVQCNHLKREYQEPRSGNWKCLGCGKEFRTIYPPASLAIFEEK